MKELDSARAWLAVAATFVASAVALGSVYSFGAFFEQMAEEFGTGKGETSVIFGITTFAFFWMSLITGRLADRYGPKPVMAVGAVGLFAGLWATSYVSSLQVGYVTFGAGAGLAAACAYIPQLAAVSAWFERRRSAAVGVAVAGIGVGTLIINPLSAWLVDRYGWSTTYRLMAVVGGAVMALCVLGVARPPSQGAAVVRARFGEALRSGLFRRLWLGAQFSGLALFVPFVFMVTYAKDRGVSSVAASTLVGLLGGASVLSRIGFGALSGRVGAFRLYRFGVLMFPVSYVVWLVAGSSFALMVVFMLLMGVGYGSFVAISPLVLAERFGAEGLGSLMGLFYTTQGLGALVGLPVAGWLIESTNGYTVPLLVSLVLGCAAAGMLVRVPLGKDGRLELEGAL